MEPGMTISEKLILSIEVAETERTRHYWLSREAQLDSEMPIAGREADILIAPWEKFREDKDLFPQGTSEFFKFIKKERPDILVAIAMSPSNYREVTLHGNEFRLPTALIKETLVAVFVGLCGEYLMHHQAQPKDVVQMELIVENASHKCISVKYKGPADTLAERIVEEVDRCLEPTAAKTTTKKKATATTPPKSDKRTLHD
jgi:hypothetical protein